MSDALNDQHPQQKLSPPDPSRDVAVHIEDLNAADGAEVLSKLPTGLSADVSEYLDPNTAADVLANMDATLAASVIADMEPPEASMVLAAMDPDDRVDILEHLPRPLHEALLAEMKPAEVEETRRLEQYPPDTAGGRMTTEVTALREDLSVQQAIEELRRQAQRLEQMYYVYVVDARNHLVGVLSMRDLILAEPGQRLSQIMISDVRRVPAAMDQEEVANLIRKYDLLALPVVDERDRLLGLVTVDDMVDVLQEEATEDVQRLFGAGAEERLSSPWQFSFKKRIWWLEVNLATAFLAAAVVGLFEQTIQKMAILAAYMPIVAGMGGNASAQAMSVAIRGIALGHIDRQLLWRVIRREAAVGLLSGTIIGLTTAIVAVVLHQGAALGVVVGLALIINHTLACLSGATIPFVMKWLGFDPAQSATIFATTVTDVAGFFCFLGLAYVFLPWLLGS
jgi:magnesium transporter